MSFSFNPLEPKTWHNASEQQMMWNGIALYTPKKEPLTQRNFVDFMQAAYAFLERKGEKFPDETKAKSAEIILTRMVKHNSLSAIEHPKCIEPELRDPDYHKNVMNSPEVLGSLDKMHRHEDAWGDACKQAEDEFRTKGTLKLNDATPGYVDRINEIYNLNLPKYLSPNYKLKKREVVEYNFDLPFEDEKGNYIFLPEQLENLHKSEEMTTEILLQIGNMILDSKKEYSHAGRKTQQKLFDTFGYLNCDWELIVRLDGARGCPSMIKQLVHDYQAE